MSNKAIVLIPARLASTRLQGKLTLMVGDVPLLKRSYESVLGATTAGLVIVVTSDKPICALCHDWDIPFIFLPKPGGDKCKNGTERVAGALNLLGIEGATTVVNFQGDTFGQHAGPVIDGLVRSVQKDCHTKVVTPIFKYEGTGSDSQDMVKVYVNEEGEHVFSRRKPTWGAVYRHFGIYAASADLFQLYLKIPQAMAEKEQGLEQLRWESVLPEVIKPVHFELPGEELLLFDVNTEEDLANADKAFPKLGTTSFGPWYNGACGGGI